MATPQIRIDSLIPGVSVFNLALNVAGIINNKRNVALYILDETNGGKQGKQDILANTSFGSFASIGQYTDIFGQSASIIDAEILETSKLTEHPLENGQVKADSKIQMPAEISVKIALPATEYKDTLEKIKEYRLNNQPIYIETKYGVFKNMQIVNIPCTLNAQNVNRVTFTLKFKQVLVAQDVGGMTNNTVANPTDATTQNTGLKTGTPTEFQTGIFRSA